MNLPSRTIWPDTAITFLLIGGQDNFRGSFGIEEYVADTRSHVPKANKTTAILYVNEMTHMPQQRLLHRILGPMLKGLSTWQGSGQPPLEHFRSILQCLSKDGWSGRLLYTATSAQYGWEDIKFSAFDVGRLQVPPMAAPAGLPEDQLAPEPVEFTRSDELKALWKAAAQVATGTGVPLAPGKGKRFAGVVKAATSDKEATGKQKPPTLPIGSVSEGLRVPSLQRSGLGVPSGTPDPTPISRALGLPARPRAFSAGSSPISPNSPHGFFVVQEPSPTRLQVR